MPHPLMPQVVGLGQRPLSLRMPMERVGSALMTHLCVRPLSCCRFQACRMQLDHRREAIHPIGKDEKFVAIEMERHRSAGHMQSPAPTEHQLHRPIGTQHLVHIRIFLFAYVNGCCLSYDCDLARETEGSGHQ